MASVHDQFRLREAFVQIGNVLESQPGAKFWAGEQYYRRQHIDIDDFYPLDSSGYGGGFEDLNVGNGRLAVAFISAARPDIVTQNGNLAKSTIDVRIYGVKGPRIQGNTYRSPGPVGSITHGPRVVRRSQRAQQHRAQSCLQQTDMPLG